MGDRLYYLVTLVLIFMCFLYRRYDSFIMYDLKKKDFFYYFYYYNHIRNKSALKKQSTIRVWYSISKKGSEEKIILKNVKKGVVNFFFHFLYNYLSY